MNKLQGQQGREGDSREDGLEDPKPRGPNLTLIYSLLALGLLAAIAVAALVVLPFYNRR